MSKKERNHKICEKFPILAMILCMLISNAIIQFAAVIPTILLKNSTLSADTKDIIIDLAMIALALLFLLILKLWFRPNYEEESVAPPGSYICWTAEFLVQLFPLSGTR